MHLYANRLKALRGLMKKSGVSAYIVPSCDEFMNEYVPEYARRLGWLTGFTGSAGTALILKDKAAFFTDGRYMLQANAQLPKGCYEIINIADCRIIDWLQDNLKNGALGINPLLFTANSIKPYKDIFKLELCADLIDELWQDKPEKSVSEVSVHALKYAGKKVVEKISAVTKIIKNNKADFLLLTAPESICWLLNIRGRDVPNTPLVLGRLLLDAGGKGVLFVDAEETRQLKEHLPKKIKLQKSSDLNKNIQKLTGKTILLDKSNTPYFFCNLLEKKNVVLDITDPCILPKACKNNVEIKGAVDAHIKDGVALTSFLCWLEKNYKKQKLNEISVAEKLLEFRKQNPDFIEPSFDTISGFASNGAIVHYHATAKTSKEIKGNNLLLLDSGGQYFSGTTDVTRTIAIGKPTAEQVRNFTLVLKGHIALANAVFPVGTSGAQLDALARQYLWQYGLDYDHGTGHGVGSFLSVHEGPQRISKMPNNVALQPGMIISNEPGYYKDGEYGIRIENLVVVEPVEKKLKGSNKQFLRFRTLTIAPIDFRLVDKKMLTGDERGWLVEYHEHIYNVLAKKIDNHAAEWLKKICKIL